MNAAQLYQTKLQNSICPTLCVLHVPTACITHTANEMQWSLFMRMAKLIIRKQQQHKHWLAQHMPSAFIHMKIMGVYCLLSPHGHFTCSRGLNVSVPYEREGNQLEGIGIRDLNM
jgi:hypothetical protein